MSSVSWPKAATPSTPHRAALDARRPRVACRAHAAVSLKPNPAVTVPTNVKQESASADGTLLMRRAVRCPFAPRATEFVHPVKWDSKRSTRANMEEQYLPHLANFAANVVEARASGTRPPDIFVIEAPGAEHAHDFPTFCRWAADVLVSIAPEAPAQLQDLQLNEDGIYPNNDWRLRFKGVELFVTTSCGLYDKDSSRFSGGAQQTQAIMHLHPKDSFKTWMPFGSSHLKRRIASLFNDAGRDYHAVLHRGSQIEPANVSKYVLPLKSSDPLVPWWKLDDAGNF